MVLLFKVVNSRCQTIFKLKELFKHQIVVLFLGIYGSCVVFNLLLRVTFYFLGTTGCRCFHKLNFYGVSPHFFLLFFLSDLVLFSFETIWNIENLFKPECLFVIDIVVALIRIRSLLYNLLHEFHQHTRGHSVN